MDKTSLQKLVDGKLTASQIAKRVGKSESSVRRALKKHGLKTHRHIDRDPNAKEKLCRYCNLVKPFEAFPIAGIVNGTLYHRNKCNVCYAGMKKDRRQSIFEWFKAIKKNSSCAQCGNNDFRVIEFHHSDGNKEFNVSEGVMKGLSRERILAEIAKCTPLCANCHRILHYEEKIRV